MNTTWTLATLLCVLAPPVESAKQPETLLYVRTTPSGAEIRLDGKPLGTSDNLFPVESGSYKIVIDLEGHQPSEQKITVRDGRITRIELQLEKDAGSGPAAIGLRRGKEGNLGFGAVTEQTLRDPEERVAELLDIDTGRRAISNEFGADDRQTHRWIRQQGVDVLGSVEGEAAGVLLFDMAVYESRNIDWDTIKPRDVWDHRGLNQTEPKPITALATTDPAKLPLTCLFQTRERNKGVLQLVGLGDQPETAKIRYKLVQQPTRLRHFVQIVVGEEKITFQGQETTWEKLPVLLEQVPNREHTVLAVAIASEELKGQRRKEAIAQAVRLQRRLGFEYVSDVGIHPLGTKAGAPHTVPVEGAKSATRPRHFVQIVVGKEKTTFQGQETTWEELPGLLEKVPHREHTVLAVAIASADMKGQPLKQAILRAMLLEQRFGFEYVSDVGVHPLGSKGEASFEVPVEDDSSSESPRF